MTAGSNNGSKQTLDSIVEAIRHLEGDHLFEKGSGPASSRPAVLPSAPQPPAVALSGVKQPTIIQGSVTLQTDDGKQIVMLKQ